MKTRTTIALIAIALLAAPYLESSDEKPEDMINRARAIIMTPPMPSTEVVAKSLVEILDASVLILPKTDYAIEYGSRIEGAKKMIVETTLFSDKAHQYLGLAYKLVTGGKAWKIPDELTSAYREADIMALAKKVCQKLIDSALAERKAGRDEQAVRYLLEFVLMVITPIEA
jgi:hypothetical protein